MKKILMGLVLSLLVSSVFALDLNKVEEVWSKSMDIATTELDSLKDFGIPKAEEVEAKVNNEMYVSELESKVKQLEAKTRLLEKEKDELKKAYDRVNIEYNNLQILNMMSDDALKGYDEILENRELEIQLLEKENSRLKELLKRKIKY